MSHQEATDSFIIPIKGPFCFQKVSLSVEVKSVARMSGAPRAYLGLPASLGESDCIWTFFRVTAPLIPSVSL